MKMQRVRVWCDFQPFGAGSAAAATIADRQKPGSSVPEFRYIGQKPG